MAKIKQPSDLENGSIHETNENGKIQIIKYLRNNDITVRFIETGYERSTTAKNIRDGVVKDVLRPSVYGVGVFGDGPYKAKIKSIITKEYELWVDMMKRCYSDNYHKIKPTYKECEVCEEWQNFQSFARWFHENKPKSMVGIAIDKDTKIKGNKLYSPDTCLFITISENSRAATEYKMSRVYVFSPKNEIHLVINQTEFCKKHSIPRKQFNDMINGKQKTCYGWKRAD